MSANPANPLAARLLLWAAARRKQMPRLHRVVCLILGSDIYCRIPEGLRLPHPYGVIVHSAAELGARVTLMQQVTIGEANGRAGSGVPRLDAGVYVGAGAVLGPVVIGDDAVVGAHAVVTRDVPARARVVGAKRILASSAAASSLE